MTGEGKVSYDSKKIVQNSTEMLTTRYTGNGVNYESQDSEKGSWDTSEWGYQCLH